MEEKCEEEKEEKGGELEVGSGGKKWLRKMNAIME